MLFFMWAILLAATKMGAALDLPGLLNESSVMRESPIIFSCPKSSIMCVWKSEHGAHEIVVDNRSVINDSSDYWANIIINTDPRFAGNDPITEQFYHRIYNGSTLYCSFGGMRCSDGNKTVNVITLFIEPPLDKEGITLIIHQALNEPLESVTEAVERCENTSSQAVDDVAELFKTYTSHVMTRLNKSLEIVTEAVEGCEKLSSQAVKSAFEAAEKCKNYSFLVAETCHGSTLEAIKRCENNVLEVVDQCVNATFQVVEECKNETFQVVEECKKDALHATEKCENGVTLAAQTNEKYAYADTTLSLLIFLFSLLILILQLWNMVKSCCKFNKLQNGQ